MRSKSQSVGMLASENSGTIYSNIKISFATYIAVLDTKEPVSER